MSANKLYGTLLDCAYRTNESGKAIIQLYLHTKEGIKCVEDSSFKPYFYAVSEDVEKTLKALKKFKFGEAGKAIKAEKSQKENQENVVKIFFNNPGDLVAARELIKEVDGVTSGLNSTIDTFVSAFSEPKNWVTIVIIALIGISLLAFFNKMKK